MSELFFTAPSTPVNEAPPSQTDATDDAFPTPSDLPIDLTFDDHGLTTLEKIYLFSRSAAPFHRIFIAHALPTFLNSVAPQDAVDYVLPLLKVLAIDEDEQVKEALVAELVSVIWWFFSHCHLIPGDVDPSTEEPSISVQAFTPILGTLLLSSNPLIGTPARYVVVELLQRIRRADDREARHEVLMEESPTDFIPGLFGKSERELFEDEVLQQIVIGMGRLDDPGVPSTEALSRPPSKPSTPSTVLTMHYEQLQSYFPLVPDLAGTTSRTSPYSSGSSKDSTPSSTTSTTSSDSSYASYSSDAGADTSRFSKVDKDKEMFPVRADIQVSASNLPTLTSPLGMAPSVLPIAAELPQSVQSTPSSLATSSSTLIIPVILTSSFTELEPLSPSFNLELPALPYQQANIIVSNQSANVSGLEEPLSTEQIPPAPRPRHATLPNPAHSTGSADASSSNNLLYPQMDSVTKIPEDQTIEPAFSPGTDNQGVSTEAEQAALGRLSSMTLMAAVTASGCLHDSIKQTFVKEVQRVAVDPVYWVRQEACFALGALAKVVPVELIEISLLPLLQSLLHDSIPQVRLSSLFAFPAVLSRIPPHKKAKLALDTLVPMSMDENGEVRTRVLESLGEVLYTFYGDPDPPVKSSSGSQGSPPEQLLRMFLGRRGTHKQASEEELRYLIGKERLTRQASLDLFYTDPSRPLICAFNFPAVALVAGRSRWTTDLRDPYLSLLKDTSSPVKRTLAASIGEIARIIGPEYAENDLVPAWSTLVSSEEEEVRIKLLGGLETFMTVVRPKAQVSLTEELWKIWEAGGWKGWREREAVATSLQFIFRLALELGYIEASFQAILGLLQFSLLDAAFAVREAGIRMFPIIWSKLQGRTEFIARLDQVLQGLATADTYRRRMTYIACQQAFLLGENGDLANPPGAEFWNYLKRLVNDPVVGVRICVARFVGSLAKKMTSKGTQASSLLTGILEKLSQDSSSEVRSYILDVPGHQKEVNNLQKEHGTPFAHTFSRPP